MDKNSMKLWITNLSNKWCLAYNNNFMENLISLQYINTLTLKFTLFLRISFRELSINFQALNLMNVVLNIMKNKV